MRSHHKSTFSICAVDRDAGDVGCAVQSKYFSVGSVVPWAKAGVGAVATQAAVSRLGRPLPGAGWIAASALTLSTAATLAYVILVVIQVRPWWEPQYIIPIAGMILGNSMTGARSPATATSSAS